MLKFKKDFFGDSLPRSESEIFFLHFKLFTLLKAVYKWENITTVHSLRLWQDLYLMSYLYFDQIGKRSLWTMKQADKVYLFAP